MAQDEAGLYLPTTSRQSDNLSSDLRIVPPAALPVMPAVHPSYDLSWDKVSPPDIVADNSSGLLLPPTSAHQFKGSFITRTNAGAASLVLIDTIASGMVFRLKFSGGYSGAANGGLFAYLSDTAAVAKQATLYVTRLAAGMQWDYLSPWLKTLGGCRLVADVPALAIGDTLSLGYSIQTARTL